MTKSKERGKGLLEVVYIMDRSGSMSGKEEDTIGGFNSMLAKQQEDLDNIIWSTVLFDHEYEVIHERVPIQEVKALSDKDYYVRGCTALLDAVGRSIDHISKCQRDMKKEDKPTKTLFIINTDGLENASEEYSFKMIRHMIEEKQEEHGWEFVYLGEDLDAAGEAARIGIRRERVARYEGTSSRRKACFDVVSTSLHDMACGESWDDTFWEDIEEVD